MYRKQHSNTTKEKIRDKISKHPNGVGIYDLSDNLILKFNNVELTIHLNISRVTVGKYLNSSLIFNKTYCFICEQ